MNTKKMCGDTAEMRDAAARICRDYLHGAWKTATAQTIGFKHISGGLSNWLYHVWLPDVLVDKAGGHPGPRQVLIRMYGQTHGERALESLLTESVIFTLLSERGLGPRLHGIFPGGRIEQFIDARPLHTAELADEAVSVQVARKMAAIHRMEVPLSKEPTWLWDTMGRWLLTAEQKLRRGRVPGLDPALDLCAHVQWLRERLPRAAGPVTFCHNDLQEGNILVRRDGRLVLIDFEYCSYNYRAFDIANHFIEWTYDYTEPRAPHYRELPACAPSPPQRELFLRHYLRAAGADDSAHHLAALQRQVRACALASHLFWGLWALVNADSSQITFGYWEYAASRLSAYLRLRDELLAQPDAWDGGDIGDAGCNAADTAEDLAAATAGLKRKHDDCT